MCMTDFDHHVMIDEGCPNHHDLDVKPVHTEVKEQFIADTEEKVNWVLRKLMEAESNYAACLTGSEVLAARAIVANSEDLAKRYKQEIDGIHFRFDSQLRKFAEEKLQGKKEKTYRTLLGSIKLTHSGGNVEVKRHLVDIAANFLDMQGAKGAVKTEHKIQVSKIPGDVIEFIRTRVNNNSKWQDGEFPFTLTPEVEGIKVTTGISELINGGKKDE